MEVAVDLDNNKIFDVVDMDIDSNV